MVGFCWAGCGAFEPSSRRLAGALRVFVRGVLPVTFPAVPRPLFLLRYQPMRALVLGINILGAASLTEAAPETLADGQFERQAGDLSGKRVCFASGSDP